MSRTSVGIREFRKDLRPIVHFQNEGFIVQAFRTFGNSDAYWT